MRKIITVLILSLSIGHVFAQKADTITIKKSDLNLKNLKTGNSTYLVYNKKSRTGPAGNFVLVKINAALTTFNNQPAYAITQQWEADTVVHTAHTLLDTKDASTLLHESWWKRLGYTAKYDFTTKKTEFTGTVTDSIKSKITADFHDSFASYNLNWHSDLIIFTLLPYKENRTMAINFYDPGFGKSKIAYYTVTGSDILKSSSGENIDCWVMEYANNVPNFGKTVQRFWISKKTREVLKEEDETPRGMRYKLKIGISGEN
ncbi:MAG TPA: hypothetical protein VEV16_04305 [Daejeonella sp.]|nr:hypothetical protein [Daejeonella sp.]